MSATTALIVVEDVGGVDVSRRAMGMSVFIVDMDERAPERPLSPRITSCWIISGKETASFQ